MIMQLDTRSRRRETGSRDRGQRPPQAGGPEPPAVENLPQRILRKRKIIRKSTLYKTLSRRYFLPRMTTNACTMKRLIRLTKNEGRAIRNNSIQTPAPRFVVGVGFLHTVFCAIFKSKHKVPLFHHDALGNYEYYIKAIYATSHLVYDRIFKDDLPKQANFDFKYATVEAPQPVFGLKLKHTSRSQVHYEGLRVENDLGRLLNSRTLEKQGLPKASMEKIKRLWKTVRRMIKTGASRKAILLEIENYRKGVGDDEEVVTRTKEIVSDILMDTAIADIRTYVNTRGCLAPNEDYKLLFKRTPQVESRKPDRGATEPMERGLASKYFSNFTVAEIQRSHNFIKLYALEKKIPYHSHDKDVRNVLRELSMNMKNVYTSRMIRFHEYCVGENGDSTIMFASTLAQEAVLKNAQKAFLIKTPQDLFRTEHFQNFNYQNGYERLKKEYLTKMKNTRTLHSFSENHVNFVCSKLLGFPLLAPDDAKIDIYASAFPDSSLNFQPSRSLVFAKMLAEQRWPANKDLLTQITLADLTSLVDALTTENDSGVKMLISKHQKLTSFYNVITAHGLIASIAISTCSFYPKKTVQKVLSLQKEMMKTYLIAVVLADFESSKEYHGYLCSLVVAYLRRTNYSESYMINMSQFAAFFVQFDLQNRDQILYNICQTAAKRPHTPTVGAERDKNYLTLPPEKRITYFIGKNNFDEDQQAYTASRTQPQRAADQPAPPPPPRTLRQYAEGAVVWAGNLFRRGRQ